MKISVCGKGGSGKSTLVALLAKQAVKNWEVLVVDADDSNSGLYKMLDFEHPPKPLMELAGGKASIKASMGQRSLFNQSQINTRDLSSDYIQRKNGIMLVGIGKILHSLEGCACPMGVLNREFLKKLHLTTDEIAVIDMEAGIEHFGRGIDEAIEHVLIAVEPSFESLHMAEKIKSLATEMRKHVSAVLNKMPTEQVAATIEEKLRSQGIEIIGTVPSDSAVFDAGLDGHTPAKGEAFDAVGEILDKLLPI